MKRFTVTFWMLIFFFSLSNAKIFDGKKKVFLYNHDSHGAATFLPKFLEKYGVNYIEVKKIDQTKIRFFPVGVSKDGETGFKYMKDPLSSAWYANFHKAVQAEKQSCGNCEVILGLYGHSVLRSHSEKGVGLSLDNSFMVADPSDASEVDKAVGWMKELADGFKSKGVDYVMFSTGVLSYGRARLTDHNSALAHAFNKKYNKDNYYFHDNVGYVNQEPRYRMGGDLDHPMNLGLGGNSFPYARGYFEGMLKLDGKEYPSWWGELEREKYDAVKTEVNKVRYLGPKSGKYKLGDKIKVKFDVDCDPVRLRSIDIRTTFVRRDNQLNSNFPSRKYYSALNFSGRCSKGNGPEEKFQLQNHSGSWCCGDDAGGNKWGEIDIEVNKNLFDNLLGARGIENLGNAGLPVYIQIHHPSTYLPRKDYSNIDWNNPENMIVIFNSNSIPGNAKIYPNGFGRGTVPISNMPKQIIQNWKGPTQKILFNKDGVNIRWEYMGFQIGANGKR